MSRAYTKQEARTQVLEQIRHIAQYWANLPDKTPLQRTEGMAHTMLGIFDGVGCLPAFDIVIRPHEDDKQFYIDEDEDYFEDGMVINDDCRLGYLLFNPEEEATP